jgi:hypothetical protein
VPLFKVAADALIDGERAVAERDALGAYVGTWAFGSAPVAQEDGTGSRKALIVLTGTVSLRFA